MRAIHFRSRRRFYDPDNLRAWLLPGLIGAAALILILVPLLYFLARSPGESPAQVPPEVARLDFRDLSKQVDLLEGKVQKLVERRNRLFPPGPAILVDTAANQIYMVQGSKVLVQDKCSTGSGLELTSEIVRVEYPLSTTEDG